jgi:hypothetical protein
MLNARTSSQAFIAIALFALAPFVGCTGVNPPKLPRSDPYLPQQIHVDSEQLRRDTAVGTPIVRRDDAGLLHVTVPLRSAISKTLYVDCYVTFFDRDGQVISKMGPFTKVLQANTPDSIAFNSTDARAAEFQVDLRYAR